VAFDSTRAATAAQWLEAALPRERDLVRAAVAAVRARQDRAEEWAAVERRQREPLFDMAALREQLAAADFEREGVAVLRAVMTPETTRKWTEALQRCRAPQPPPHLPAQPHTLAPPPPAHVDSPPGKEDRCVGRARPHCHAPSPLLPSTRSVVSLPCYPPLRLSVLSAAHASHCGG